MNRDDLIELTGDDELLFADDFDDALVGVAVRNGQPPVVVYDRDVCIQILVSRGMTEEQAEEHFEFNVVGAWVGERTPAFLVRPDGIG